MAAVRRVAHQDDIGITASLIHGQFAPLLPGSGFAVQTGSGLDGVVISHDGKRQSRRVQKP